MDVAVLSDIHGNYIALKKCLDYTAEHGIHTYIFLGDYLGELPYPQRTMELIYQLQKDATYYFIKGNKEDYWLNYKKDGEQGWKDYDSTTGSLYQTYHNMTAKDYNFFASLDFRGTIQFENLPALTICHGSPNRVGEKLTADRKETYEILKQSETDIILCGHYHVQTRIEENGKYIFNPGSVGVPLHSDGKSQFMILHGENNRWKEEFISLDYDRQKVIQELYESHFMEYAPCWSRFTEHLLLTGEISHGQGLARAMQLCREENGNCNWPEIPEKYWKQATLELIGPAKGMK